MSSHWASISPFVSLLILITLEMAWSKDQGLVSWCSRTMPQSIDLARNRLHAKQAPLEVNSVQRSMLPKMWEDYDTRFVCLEFQSTSRRLLSETINQYCATLRCLDPWSRRNPTAAPHTIFYWRAAPRMSGAQPTATPTWMWWIWWKNRLQGRSGGALCGCFCVIFMTKSESSCRTKLS